MKRAACCPWLTGLVLCLLLGPAAAALDVLFGPRGVIDQNYSWAYGMFTADIDSDGDLDVAGCFAADDVINWSENVNGDGSAWSEHIVDSTADGVSQVYGTDIDGDGDMDLLGASHDAGAVNWYENVNGDGAAWSKHVVDASFAAAFRVRADDVDGDGDMDVLAGGGGGNDDIAWWENTAGDGSSWTKHTVDPAFNDPDGLFSADLDGDGDLDIVGAAQYDNDVIWWENDGTPRDDVGGDGNSWSEHVVDADFGGAYSVYAADIDRDGNLDIVGAAINDDLVVWWENTDGTGLTWIEHTVGSGFDSAVATYAADLDYDGDFDVLGAAAIADDITWWENVNANGTTWIEHTVDGTFNEATTVAAADLDSDGDMDVVAAAHSADGIAWWENGLINAAGPQTDSDGDGMPDDWETANGLNPAVNDALGDLDSDGLSNIEEYRINTDPNAPDPVGAVKMYWTEGIPGSVIRRADLDGTDVEGVVTTGLSYPREIALDVASGKMYWTDSDTGKVQRANLDGSTLEDLVTGLISPVGIALDLVADKIYWADNCTGEILRANLDGSAVETLVTVDGDGYGPYGIALDLANGKMYWTEILNGKIRRASLDGSSIEDLVTSSSSRPVFLALDLPAGKMYWTDTSTSPAIRRANLDGSSIEDLVTSGLSAPLGISLDLVNGKMYWADTQATPQTIQRSNLDGTNLESLITTGLNNPIDIALATRSGECVYESIFEEEWPLIAADLGLQDNSPHTPGTRIPERWGLAMVRKVLCTPEHPHHDATVAAYLFNLGALENEAPEIASRVEPYRHVLAALLLVNQQRQDHFKELLGLENEYEVVRSPGKTIDEPFSEEGDLDGNGVSNLIEYENILFAGGTIEDFAEAAADPFVEGPPVPALGPVGLALLGVLLLTALVTCARHKRRNGAV